MPTGYTQDIKNDITFEKFILGCAKAFGACISMREEPSETPIPKEFEASDYNLKRIESSKQELFSLECMSAAEIELSCIEDWNAAEDRRINSLNDSKSLRKKYLKMLDKAKEWVSPTEGHNGLKSFMIEQIESSIKWDCSEDYYSTPRPKITPTEWINQQLSEAKKDVEYHTKGNQEELDRVNNRNQWVKDLRTSLENI